MFDFYKSSIKFEKEFSKRFWKRLLIGAAITIIAFILIGIGVGYVVCAIWPIHCRPPKYKIMPLTAPPKEKQILKIPL